MLRQLGSARLAGKKHRAVKPTASTSSATCSSPDSTDSCVLSDSSSDSDDEIEITKETTGTVDKYGPLAKLQESD